MNLVNNPTTRINNSCSPRAGSSQKPSHGDILGTKSGIIDLLDFWEKIRFLEKFRFFVKFWISLRLFLDFSVISLMHYPIIAPFHGSHTYKLGPLASSLLHISAKTLFFDEYTSRKLCEFIFRQNTNVSETKTLYRSLWTFRRPQVVTFFRYQEWTT